MDLPVRCRKGSWQNWAGRAVLFGGVGLFMYRAVTEWSRSGLGLLADALIIAIAVTGSQSDHRVHGAAVARTRGVLRHRRLHLGDARHRARCWTPFIADNIWTPGWTFAGSGGRLLPDRHGGRDPGVAAQGDLSRPRHAGLHRGRPRGAEVRGVRRRHRWCDRDQGPQLPASDVDRPRRARRPRRLVLLAVARHPDRWSRSSRPG